MSNNRISYRELLNFYISQYNSTLSQINGLQNRLDNISDNILSLVMAANNNINYNTSNRRLTTTNVNTTTTNRTTNTPYLNTNVRANTTHTSSTGLSNLLTSFFNNIEVVPTQQQINNATRNLVFRDIVNPTNDVCPISLERFQPTDHVTQIRWCGHIFRRRDLLSWFNHNVRCPVCRYDIRNYTENQSIRTNQSAPTTDISGNNISADPIVEDVESSDSEIDTETSNTNTNSTNNTTSNLSSALAEYAINSIFSEIMPLRPLNLNPGQSQTYYDSSNNVIMFETIYRR